ncbi:MAG: nickel-responsive transcriptional regulator NikR [Bacteroidales bacterium]|nr:nickel-responsive transcriptional regulator NikR [Bacteroidales bacterium]
MALKRFGVSLDEKILNELDLFVNENQFPNRSQAIRHLIEKNIVEKKWQCNNQVAGAVVLVYDHHKREIDSKMNEVQHDYHHLILAAQHIHLSHDTCLETISVKGKAKDLTELADKLITIKGVMHGKLVMTRAE